MDQKATSSAVARVLCQPWYHRYPLSYRNLEEMMAERGLQLEPFYDRPVCDTAAHQNSGARLVRDLYA